MLFVLFFVSGIMSAQELVPFSMSHDIKSVVYHTVDAKGNLLSVSKDSIALDSGDFFNGQATIYSFVTTGDKTTKVKLPISFPSSNSSMPWLNLLVSTSSMLA